MMLNDRKYPENLQIETLTKDLMHKYLPHILHEVKGFQYTNWKQENYLKDLPDKWKYSLAAIVDQTICGFSVNSNKSGIFYIHFFYVFKDYRKIGIAKYLLIACEKICRKESRTSIQLKCPKNNKSAMRFYERNGFNIAGIEEKKKINFILEKKIS
jgi:ribosomal protein S18 acetylase RimI-like enzyme